MKLNRVMKLEVVNGPRTEISFPHKGICVPKSAQALSTLPGINLL